MSSHIERPTLPSIYELGLVPTLPDMTKLSLHDTEMTDARLLHHQRRTSASSASTLTSGMSSRSPSPTLYDEPTSRSDTKPKGSAKKLSPTPRTPSPSPPIANIPYALAPCPFDEADAVLLFPPPNENQGGKKGIMMLTGETMRQLRQPERRLARGARMQPYKFVRDTRRRSITPNDKTYDKLAARVVPGRGTCVPSQVYPQ
ncbi:hypothetical protein BD626DRAFT_59894 [Schizophyllum amplum]|uniref:Uncharacterized protein n=1 Tax=Schizophyllum amplum TaxID=97359 RepID=A0A550CC08_9AGAR|nr:hypothetical protein BD626DRAFT_59894 [Auriculariopsis ampla]